MKFTLKHVISSPNGSEREYLAAANEVSYRVDGEENSMSGVVSYSDGTEDSPIRQFSGEGVVYVMNQEGRTVAKYWLGNPAALS